MVVVLSHLCFVVLPSILVAAALAAEKGGYRVEFLSRSGKKEDDYGSENNHRSNRGMTKFCVDKRWIRKILLVVCLVICWKHLKNCRALMKAYEMNPFLHFPGYGFSVPLLLAYTIYKTRGVQWAVGEKSNTTLPLTCVISQGKFWIFLYEKGKPFLLIQPHEIMLDRLKNC